MPLFCIIIVVIYLLIVIIYGPLLNSHNRFILIFDKLKHCLLLSMKKFHFWILINFCLLSVIKRLKPLTIDCATHPTSDLYQGNLRLQALISNLSIACDIFQKIAFQKHS